MIGFLRRLLGLHRPRRTGYLDALEARVSAPRPVGRVRSSGGGGIRHQPTVYPLTDDGYPLAASLGSYDPPGDNRSCGVAELGSPGDSSSSSSCGDGGSSGTGGGSD